MASKPIRKAASLILCRQSQTLNTFYDYEVLLMERKSNMRAFGSVLAFPGGKEEFIKDTDIAKTFSSVKEDNHPYLNISKATALRQCFEQTGLLFTQDPIFEQRKIDDLNQIKIMYLAEKLKIESQERMKLSLNYETQQESFLSDIFKKLSNVIPLKHDILPFMRLVTNPILPSRYDAYFYIHKIEKEKVVNFLKFAENEKHIHSDEQIIFNGEYKSFQWWNPLEVIRKFVDKKIKLASPQFIMLNIMSSFFRFEEFKGFMQSCNRNPINMGPNLTPMIKNNGELQAQFPFSATLLGDNQFPFQQCAKEIKNLQIAKEILSFESKLSRKETFEKNRILFCKPQQQFLQDFSKQCTIENCVMNKFQSSNKVRELLEKVQ